MYDYFKHKTVIMKKGVIMTDLTLNEYQGVPEDELKAILREERQKMFGVDHVEIIEPGLESDALCCELPHVTWIESGIKCLNKMLWKKKIREARAG